MLVLKFGGTSVQEAAAVRRVAAIVAARADEPLVVVVSAAGGVTNALLEAGAAAGDGRAADAARILAELRVRHRAMACDLTEDAGALRDFEAYLEPTMTVAEAALRELAMRTGDAEAADRLLATGELLSSRVVTLGLRGADIDAGWVDIRPLLRTNADFGRARVDFEASTPLLRDAFAGEAAGRPRALVTQGFIGATPGGQTTTIGRGGSDLSASILGAALGVREIQIWTDVDGIMTTDPRVVPEARSIPEMTFAEAAELAYFGAKVLHPSTLRPAMSRDIPVRVLNSHRPEARGTTIRRAAAREPRLVTAIACKRGITVLKVTSDRMLMAHGFLARLFEVFSRHETAVDMVTTSEVSVSMTLDDTRRLDVIREELSRIGEVTVDADQAIVCVVGDGLRSTPGLVARIFTTLADHPVSMISHGASAINLSFVVPGGQVEPVVRALHAEFWGRSGAPTAGDT
jgi:aspartate kinase